MLDVQGALSDYIAIGRVNSSRDSLVSMSTISGAAPEPRGPALNAPWTVYWVRVSVFAVLSTQVKVLL